MCTYSQLILSNLKIDYLCNKNSTYIGKVRQVKLKLLHKEEVSLSLDGKWWTLLGFKSQRVQNFFFILKKIEITLINSFI